MNKIYTAISRAEPARCALCKPSIGHYESHVLTKLVHILRFAEFFSVQSHILPTSATMPMRTATPAMTIADHDMASVLRNKSLGLRRSST